MSAVRLSDGAIADRVERSTLKAREAAAYIGCSYWKLNELRKAGKIPFVDLDGMTLYRRESLDQWLAEREATSTQRRERAPEPGKIRRLLP
jgi:excisionase family DNA binding protein